jgi:hypothetical protein
VLNLNIPTVSEYDLRLSLNVSAPTVVSDIRSDHCEAEAHRRDVTMTIACINYLPLAFKWMCVVSLDVRRS